MTDPSANIRVTWTGDAALMEWFASAGRKIGGRQLYQATRKAAGVVSRVAKANLKAKRTGLLRQSIGYKVSQRPNGNCYAKIGARRDYVAIAMPTRRGRRRARRVSKDALAAMKAMGLRLAGKNVIRPSRYLHLIEKGHVARDKRTKVAGEGFLQRAAEQSRPEIQNVFREHALRALAKSPE